MSCRPRQKSVSVCMSEILFIIGALLCHPTSVACDYTRLYIASCVVKGSVQQECDEDADNQCNAHIQCILKAFPESLPDASLPIPPWKCPETVTHG